MTVILSEQERHILLHTLGGPRNYRNHFVTDVGTDAYPVVTALVERGLMEYAATLSWVPGDIYRVTTAGREAVGIPEGFYLYDWTYRFVTARKEHACHSCARRILPGERHVMKRVMPWECDCGGFWTYRAHPECHSPNRKEVPS